MEPKNGIYDGDVVTCEDKMLLNPYNDKNKEITLNDIQCILRTYGVTAPINNIELYKRAFVNQSYTARNLYNPHTNEPIPTSKCPKTCIPLKSKSNERLEFIGDGVLELITKYYLYRRFPKADEGFMTEKKIAIVKNEHIGKLAYEMNLHKWVLISKYAESKNLRTNLKKLGCLFEAFIGALFLDFNRIDIKDEHGWFENVFKMGPGFMMAQVFVENILEQRVDWVGIINTNDNYKNILQVKIQKIFKTTPHYVDISHDPINGYSVKVYICIGLQIHTALDTLEPRHISTYGYNMDNIINDLSPTSKLLIELGTGTNRVKRKAEQLACEDFLLKMK
uniref:RNase III domain-containing protein n=1 Tax=viral metagenome TaxID=1070528 RepID=A0A6C0BSS3_9ZZZZ